MFETIFKFTSNSDPLQNDNVYPVGYESFQGLNLTLGIYQLKYGSEEKGS